MFLQCISDVLLKMSLSALSFLNSLIPLSVLGGNRPRKIPAGRCCQNCLQPWQTYQAIQTFLGPEVPLIDDHIEEVAGTMWMLETLSLIY